MLFVNDSDFQCDLMPTKKKDEPIHIASLRPPHYALNSPRSISRVAQLTVAPASISKLDDLVLSALYVQRMFVSAHSCFTIPTSHQSAPTRELALMQLERSQALWFNRDRL